METRHYCFKACILWALLGGSLVSAEPPTWRNVLRNASFEEQTKQGLPVGWQWKAAGAKAAIALDETTAHSGLLSLRLTNEGQTPAQLSQSCFVRPNRTYTLSCYVKSSAPGTVWIGGGTRGNLDHKFAVPASPNEWTRVSGTFTSHHREFRFAVLVVSEDDTPGVWIDDIMLEEGPTASDFTFEPPLPSESPVLLANDEPVAANMLPNSSFEALSGGTPQGWTFSQRNTDATLTVDDKVAHSGRHSLFFTNGTPFGAHVYGLLSLEGDLKVKPNTAYTLSAYVRTTGPLRASLATATKWRLRCGVPNTRGKWRWISNSFVTGPDEDRVPVLVITAAPTSGFWVDDIKFEEGSKASAYVPREGIDAASLEVSLRPRRPAMSKSGPVQQAWAPSLYPPDKTVELNDGLWLDGMLQAPPAKEGLLLSVRATGDQSGQQFACSKRLTLSHGVGSFAFGLGLRDTPDRTLAIRCTLTDTAGTQLAEQQIAVDLITRNQVRKALEMLRPIREQLRDRVERLTPKGLESRGLATLTILDKFSEYATQDANRGEVGRALDAVNTMIEMGKSRIAECDDILAGRRSGFPAYRYQTSPIRIDRASFVASSQCSVDSETSERPVLFLGYGHFNCVRRDVEVFPEYGANIIQVECGPRSIFTGPDKMSNGAIDAFLTLCDRAAASGVAVNLLLSPHYFPSWALEKWPHLKQFEGGFLQHDINAPESRFVIEQSLRYLIPKIKDHPALHSVCLSNEPVCCDMSQSKYGTQLWHEWLRKHYGTIKKANQAWQTTFDSFESVPVLKDFDDSPVTRDYVRFNQEQFAGWHRWMADIIHELAPGLPVHAKIMMMAHWRRNTHGIWSVAPQLFGELSQIHGNDCSKWYTHPERAAVTDTPWISDWLPENMGFDLQRSMGDKPIFNSENHFIVDRDLDFVPAAHVYNVMWQAAVHGMGASTSWVWERTFDNGASFAGSIMHRPACTEAQNLACLDLNRLAVEVTALQEIRPQVVLLSSMSSTIYDPEYVPRLRDAYAAFCLSGVPVGFVTERQLESWANRGDEPYPLTGAKVLVVPHTTAASDGVIAGVKNFADSGRSVVQIGECFTHNDFNIRRDAAVPPVDRQWQEQPLDELWTTACAFLQEMKLASRIQLVDDSGELVLGIELRAVDLNGRLLVNLANYLRKPIRGRLVVDGRTVTGEDLISLTPTGETFTLDPMMPMLIEITDDGTE